MRYLVPPKDRIFVIDYRFFCLSKNMGKIIGKYISENLSATYCQKPLYHDKQSARDAFKTASKRAIQKTAKLLIKLRGFQKKSQQNNSETVTIEYDNKIPKEIYIYIYIYIYMYI